MATKTETEQAVLDSIQTITNEIQARGKAASPSVAHEWASAVRELAEAYARLHYPDNSHGGGVAVKA